jgi:hypothetical protein
MKKAKLPYLLLPLLFLVFLKTPAFAQDVQTGNASAQSTVTNTVNGSGCSTHMEIIVNGERRVLDSTDCGTHTLSNTANATEEEVSPKPSIIKPVLKSPTVSILPSSTSSATPQAALLEKKEIHESSFISNFVKKIQEFFKGLFKNL